MRAIEELPDYDDEITQKIDISEILESRPINAHEAFLDSVSAAWLQLRKVPGSAQGEIRAVVDAIEDAMAAYKLSMKAVK